jgi:hypothetical protein
VVQKEQAVGGRWLAILPVSKYYFVYLPDEITGSS